MLIDFSLLMTCSDRVLHLAVIALFPFRFTWRITSDLLILCGIIHILALSWTTDYVIVMHTLSLGHHATESSSVREHLISITSGKVLTTNHVLIFVTSGKLLVLPITWLTLNINGRLRSNSVFGRSRTRFLRVGSTLLSHTLTANCMISLSI